MESTATHRAGLSIRRTLIAATVGAVLLSEPAGIAATSLVAVHAGGGPGHGAIARLADDDVVVVSRSVGLMKGAEADPSATALGDAQIEVSRSVGLMAGARD